MSRHRHVAGLVQEYYDGEEEEEDDYYEEEEEYYGEDGAGDFAVSAPAKKAPGSNSSNNNNNVSKKNAGKATAATAGGKQQIPPSGKSKGGGPSNSGSQTKTAVGSNNPKNSKGSTSSLGKQDSLSEAANKSTSSLSLEEESIAALSITTPVETTTKPAKKHNQKIDIKAEYGKRNNDEQRLNLVVVGHVDAGKSTLMGHVLLKLGEVNDRTIAKFKKEAEGMKKGSFMFAWVLDATEDERARGVTIDVGVSQFKTSKRTYTLLDAPGHRDFVPNMISGTSQADVSILVVDAATGGFESGFESGGQTREHAQLLKSLGVVQVIVAINKMDTALWSQDRFEEIKTRLSEYLGGIGFEMDLITFVPVSGFTGDNLIAKPAKSVCSWYQGPTLVEALDSFTPPTRPIDAPFTLSVQDFFKGGLGPGGSGAVTVSGRIEAGSIQLGQRVLALPINEQGTVKGIQVGDDDASWAVAGDRVSISLADLDILQVHLGTVICDPVQRVPITSRVRAQITTFELAQPLTIGVPVVMHHLGTSEPASIAALESSVNSKGESKNKPRSLASGTTAIVIIQIERPICCQIASISPELGRFLLRKGSASVASGIVLEILK